jgi:hypothetical protein
MATVISLTCGANRLHPSMRAWPPTSGNGHPCVRACIGIGSADISGDLDVQGVDMEGGDPVRWVLGRRWGERGCDAMVHRFIADM